MGIIQKLMFVSIIAILMFPITAKANTTQDEYVIISNESTNPTDNQFTGTFQINGASEPYQIDGDIPFDAQKYKNRSTRKSIYSLSTVYQLGDSKSFWVTDFTDYSAYQIPAKLLYNGQKVNVWVNNNQISSQSAAKLGAEFDNNIRPVIEQYFGKESDVDRNGKVNILVYDIKDGFNGSGGYVGGYFYGGDLFNQEYSNQSEIFYIDTYPLMGTTSIKDVTASYDTLAHEFQHMVNFNRNVFVEGTYTQMDVWLDEALSMAAEHIYNGQVLSDRIDYYNSSASITNGQSLLNWDEKGDILSNYSLAYLFGQYVKVQANQGNNIFKEILESPNNDYRAVEEAVKKYIDPTMSFGKFMTSFRAGLLLKEPTGLYGFKGDAAFNTIQPKIYTGSSAYLQGGGAVVRKIKAGETYEVPVTKGSTITYTLIDRVAPTLPIVNAFSNVDTQVTGKTEANAKVFVTIGNSVIGSGNADSSGEFMVNIPLQEAGTKLLIYAEDLSGNKSEVQTITVIDKIAPETLTVNRVSNQDTKVTGKTEANVKLYIKVGGRIIGSGKADSAGLYSVSIPSQKGGTKLSVQAVDAGGNRGTPVITSVYNKEILVKPKTSVVGKNQTVVAGRVKPNAYVFVKLGRKVVATTKANKYGIYSLTLKKQEIGTVLNVFAFDNAGNIHQLKKVKR